jgi:hypothetical protein
MTAGSFSPFTHSIPLHGLGKTILHITETGLLCLAWNLGQHVDSPGSMNPAGTYAGDFQLVRWDEHIRPP